VVDNIRTLSEFDGKLDSIEILQKFMDDAQNEVNVAKKKLEEVSSSLKMRQKLYEYHQKGWSTHFYQLIDENKKYFDNLKKTNLKLFELIENLYEKSKNDSESTLKRFPNHFEKACFAAGLDIDLTSHHPHYRVCKSFLEIEVSDKSRTVRIFDREGTLDKMASDIDAVIESLKLHNKRLFDRDFNAKKFVTILYNQYNAIMKKEKKPFGESLPIRRITTRMGKNIKGFRTDEFIVDISQLVHIGVLEVDGYKLDLQQTKSNNQGILLHGFETRGYIGFISFKKVMDK